MLLLLKQKSRVRKAKLFLSFSDPLRLAFLNALREEPLAVPEIAEAIALNQSKPLNHFSHLRDRKLVSCKEAVRSTTNLVMNKNATTLAIFSCFL